MKEEKELFPPQINICQGVGSCGGNAELYQEIVSVFLTEGRKKLPLIKRLYKEENWESYIVAVHGLKSSARTLGALDLSESAKTMEFAGREGNIGLIHEKTDALLSEYLTLLQMLAGFCKNKTEAELVMFWKKHC